MPATLPSLDAGRTDDVDALAHAFTTARFACDCGGIASDYSSIASVWVRSPRTGKTVIVPAHDAGLAVPGIVQRIKCANGRATFTLAELTALKATADRISAARADSERSREWVRQAEAEHAAKHPVSVEMRMKGRHAPRFAFHV